MKPIEAWQRWKQGLWAAAACGLLLGQAPVALADVDNESNGQWTMGGQNLTNSRNQEETTIRPNNVSKLSLKWVFTTDGDVTATPAVVNGIVYFPDFAGNFYAVNANTGALVWQRKVSSWTQVSGDYSRNDPVVYDDMVMLGDQAGQLAKWDADNNVVLGAGARVIAVSASIGKLVWESVVETFPGATVTGSPVVYDGVLYVGVTSAEEGLTLSAGYPCCVSRGSVVALDAHSGKKLWQTYMVPDNNGVAGSYSGGGIWGSTPVIDPMRNAIYVGTGNNYSVPASVTTCYVNTPNNTFVLMRLTTLIQWWHLIYLPVMLGGPTAPCRTIPETMTACIPPPRPGRTARFRSDQITTLGAPDLICLLPKVGI